jgi:hypothetical protein
MSHPYPENTHYCILPTTIHIQIHIQSLLKSLSISFFFHSLNFFHTKGSSSFPSPLFILLLLLYFTPSYATISLIQNLLLTLFPSLPTASSSYLKFLPQVLASSSCLKFLPQVLASSSCLKFLPQVPCRRPDF